MGNMSGNLNRMGPTGCIMTRNFVDCIRPRMSAGMFSNRSQFILLIILKSTKSLSSCSGGGAAVFVAPSPVTAPSESFIHGVAVSGFFTGEPAMDAITGTNVSSTTGFNAVQAVLLLRTSSVNSLAVVSQTVGMLPPPQARLPSQVA